MVRRAPAPRISPRSLICPRLEVQRSQRHRPFFRPVDTIAAGGPYLPVWLQQKLFGGLLRLINGDPRRLGLQKPDHKLFETPPPSTMLIHHLQDGNIADEPGIARTEGSTVHFTDGTSDDFDLILLATGYVHKVPVAQ
jgi:hypothetical protein